jgi:hypothetical protein
MVETVKIRVDVCGDGNLLEAKYESSFEGWTYEFLACFHPSKVQKSAPNKMEMIAAPILVYAHGGVLNGKFCTLGHWFRQCRKNPQSPSDN